MENAIMVAAALIGAGICMGLAAIGAGLDWGYGYYRRCRRSHYALR